jgi:hypothetical protein
MNAKDLIIPGAILLGVYLMRDTLGAMLGGTSGAPAPQVPAPAPAAVTIYPPEVYHTVLPVTSSEPGVSEGILPPDFTGGIPLCPSIVGVHRYPSDDQECCQCPGGWLHCGTAYSMETQVSQGLILAVCKL